MVVNLIIYTIRWVPHSCSTPQQMSLINFSSPCKPVIYNWKIILLLFIDYFMLVWPNAGWTYASDVGKLDKLLCQEVWKLFIFVNKMIFVLFVQLYWSMLLALAKTLKNLLVGFLSLDEPLLLASVQSELLLLGVHSSTLRRLSSASRPVFSLDYHWAQQRVYWLSPDYQSIRWADMKSSHNKGTLIKGTAVSGTLVVWMID